MIDLLLHEYFLISYGVLLWEAERTVEGMLRESVPQLTFRQRLACILRGMGWAGLAVIFDDELLARYNEWAQVDYSEIPTYGYVVIGFLIDIVVSKVKGK